MPLYVLSRADQSADATLVEAAKTLAESVGAKVVSTAAGTLVLMVEAEQLGEIKRVLPDWRYSGETKAWRTP